MERSRTFPASDPSFKRFPRIINTAHPEIPIMVKKKNQLGTVLAGIFLVLAVGLLVVWLISGLI